MADVYKVGVGLQLTGNLDRQLSGVLRELGKVETAARRVQTELNKWGVRAQTFDGIRRLENNLRGVVGVAQRTGRDMGSALRGGMTPALNEARSVRSVIQGWGTAASNATSRINSAASAMRRAAGAAGGAAGGIGGVGAGGVGGGRQRGPGNPAGGGSYGGGHGINHAGAATLGFAGIGVIKQLAHNSGELSHAIVQVKKLGVDNAELAEARKAARAATASIHGVTEAKALDVYGQSYGMFGHKNSVTMMPSLIKFAEVAGNTSGDYKGAYESMYSMLRSGDLMGKFVDEKTHDVDTDRLQHFLDLGGKVTQATHGRVNAQTWLNLANQGGPALSTMSDEGLIHMAIAAQAMGGPRAGTALTSLYQQMIGGKMTEPVYSKLEELGLAKGHKVLVKPETRSRKGEVVSAKYKHIRDGIDPELQEALKRDPISAVEIMRKAMSAHGFDTIEKQVPVLFEILGRQTTQRLVHDLLRNMPQVTAEGGRMLKGMGTGDSKTTADSEDFTQAVHNVDAAWKNLMATLGNSEAMIGILNRITAALEWMNEKLRGMDPDQLKRLGDGLLVLGGALTAAAGVAILSFLGPAGVIVLGIGALGFALMQVDWKKVWDLFLDNLKGIIPAIQTIAGELGKEIMSWPNRVGDTISAMGAKLVEMLKKAFSLSENGADPSADNGSIDNPSFFQRQNFRGGGFGGLIHKASLGGGDNSTAISRGAMIGTGLGHVAPNAERIAFIRKRAAELGIDPNTAVKVASSEGLGRYVGDGGKSFGDFQLYTGGGVGNRALAAGINVRDPRQWKAADDYALRTAKREGWGAWHGWHGHPWHGINRGSATSPLYDRGDRPLPRRQHAAPPPKPATPPGRGDTIIQVDGRELGRATSTHLARGMNGPTRSAAMFDGQRHYTPVDINAA